ncbi:MAG: hypothetical protein B6D61_13335 [Bacteroidetes bacterium 4484_249]|nr:MAG: hypothetical protein B6D61_13335 [Bacteroidetes bacterium 4484_249]
MPNSFEIGRDITLDTEEYVYVTGSILNSLLNYDYTIIKYNPFSGNTECSMQYDGIGNGDDNSNAIITDNEKKIYITGESEGDTTGLDFATIKYSNDISGTGTCNYLMRNIDNMYLSWDWSDPPTYYHTLSITGVHDGEGAKINVFPPQYRLWFIMDAEGFVCYFPPSRNCYFYYQAIIACYDPAIGDTVYTIKTPISSVKKQFCGLARDNRFFGSLWFTVLDETNIYHIITENSIDTFNIDIDSIMGLAFDFDNNHLWCIASGSPDMFYEYNVSDSAVLIQSMIVPWDSLIDNSAAGLEYHEDCNMIVAVNKNKHTIERFCDLTPEGTGGVEWIDKCTLGLEYPPDPFGIALVKDTEEAFIAGNTQGGPFPLDVYSNSCSSFGITLDLKVYMEGPFTIFGMYTALFNGGLLPLSQPYNVPPWNYSGIESVQLFPNTNIVDWVLIELRDASGADSATEATMIARQAAFLLNDGSIVGLDGISMLKFYKPINDSLFVVIWHRNHLGIMSTIPLTETGGIYSYNFTTSSAQAYGINAQKELAPGVWGMIASDGNADGQVNIDDKDNVWAPQAGEAGYKSGDYNLNGQVANPDKNYFWVPNIGKGSQVPD